MCRHLISIKKKGKKVRKQMWCTGVTPSNDFTLRHMKNIKIQKFAMRTLHYFWEEPKFSKRTSFSRQNDEFANHFPFKDYVKLKLRSGQVWLKLDTHKWSYGSSHFWGSQPIRPFVVRMVVIVCQHSENISSQFRALIITNAALCSKQVQVSSHKS